MPLSPSCSAGRDQRLKQTEGGWRPLQLATIAPAVKLIIKKVDRQAEVRVHDSLRLARGRLVPEVPPVVSLPSDSPATSLLARSLSKATVRFCPTPNASAAALANANAVSWLIVAGIRRPS